MEGDCEGMRVSVNVNVGVDDDDDVGSIDGSLVGSVVRGKIIDGGCDCCKLDGDSILCIGDCEGVKDEKMVALMEGTEEGFEEYIDGEIE